MRDRMLPVGALLLALALSVGACGESLTATNQNPNEPTDVPGEALLPNLLAETANQAYSGFWHMRLWAPVSQLYTEIQYPDEDRYTIRRSVLQGHWDNFYSDILIDAQTMIDKGSDTGNAAAEAIGRILKAYNMAQVTDAWGPVPYSEALKAEEGNIAPGYDAQASIYASMLNSLATAISLIDSGEGGIDPGNDIMFGADMQRWRMFAQSLRLKLAMRLTTAPGGAPSGVNLATIIPDAAAGAFTGNATHARLDYPGSSPNEHPVYEDKHRSGRDDHSPAETLLAQLRSDTGWDDPRLQVFAEPAPNSSPGDPEGTRFQGGISGVSGQPFGSLDDIARIGAFFRDDPSSPAWLMSYAEVEFLKAEAAMRGYLTSSAQTHYENGVQAGIEMYGVDMPAGYLSQNGVAWGSTGTTTPMAVDSDMERIGVQKWITLYGGLTAEAYTEIRRLGFPNIQPGPDAACDGCAGPDGETNPPNRIQYPALELSLNESSYNDAVSQYLGGNDDLGTPMYWDPDPNAPFQ